MARLIFSVMGVMLFGALLGVHGMLTEDIDVDGPYTYSYVEEGDGDHQSISVPPNAYAHPGLTDSNKMLQFEMRGDVTTTPTPYASSHEGGLRLPALGRTKRTAYWYPHYLHWRPQPYRPSHHEHDSYLGKVKRDITTTLIPYASSHDSELRLPALQRAKRSAHWYPYYLHWHPHPYRPTHHEHDSYLGKVKREAPTPLSYNTKFSSHEGDFA